MYRKILWLIICFNNLIQLLIKLGGGFSYGPNGEQQIAGNGFAHLQDATRRGKKQILII